MPKPTGHFRKPRGRPEATPPAGGSARRRQQERPVFAQPGSSDPFAGEYRSLLAELKRLAPAPIMAMALLFLPAAWYGRTITTSTYLPYAAITVALALTIYVLKPNIRLCIPYVVLWVLSLLLVSSLPTPTSTEPADSPPLIGHLSAGAIVLAWLMLAIRSSGRLVHHLSADGKPHPEKPMPFATLLMVWGFSVQVVYVSSMFFLPVVEHVFGKNPVTATWKEFLISSSRLSILHWMPAASLLIGYLMVVAVRFLYDLPDFPEIQPVATKNSFLVPVLHAITLLQVILLGAYYYLRHFIIQAFLLAWDFVELWLVRLVILILSAIATTFLFMISHASIKFVFLRIATYVSQPALSLRTVIVSFIEIHGLLLSSLVAYGFAALLMATPLKGTRLVRMLVALAEDSYRFGLAAAIAVVSAFVPFVLLLITIPVTSLFPPSPSFGPFCFVYTTIVLVIFASLYRKVKETRRSSWRS